LSDSDTEHLYDRAGFGRPASRGSRPAVVVVDFSRGFTDTSYPTGSDMSAQVAATAGLVEAARAKGCPIAYTTIAFEANGKDGGAWLQKMPGLAVLEEGTPPVELDPNLDRRPEDTLITKKGASAFFGTNLAAVLVAQRVDTVILCGATTSGCVRASAVDAVQHGFPTLVPRECVADRAPGPHDANLFDIQAKYADVLPLEHVMTYVESLPAPTTATRA
jgi:N-formylmaleamate deformylase